MKYTQTNTGWFQKYSDQADYLKNDSSPHNTRLPSEVAESNQTQDKDRKCQL